MLRFLWLACAIVLFLSGCSGGGEGSGDLKLGPTVSGKAEKGPYSETSTIIYSQLDSSGTVLNSERSGLTDIGRFSANIAWEGWTEIEVMGQTISEIDISKEQEVTLSAIRDLDGTSITSNVNVFTHLHASRTLALVSQGSTFEQAAARALKDLSTAFSLQLSDLDKLAQISLSSSASSTDLAEGALLVLSAAISARDNVATDISTLDNDFADDGTLNGVGLTLLENLREVAKGLNLEVPMSNIRTLMGNSVTFEALGYSMPAWVVGQAEVKNEVVNASAKSIAVDLYDSSNGDLVLSGAAATEVERGTVLVADRSTAAPSGVLARIVGKEEIKGQVIAVTEPASLTDVFESGVISIRVGDGLAVANGSASSAPQAVSGAVSAASHSNYLSYRTMLSPYPYRRAYAQGYRTHALATGDAEPDPIFTSPTPYLDDKLAALDYCLYALMPADDYENKSGKLCPLRSRSGSPSGKTGLALGILVQKDLKEVGALHIDQGTWFGGASVAFYVAADFDVDDAVAQLDTTIDFAGETGVAASLGAAYNRTYKKTCDRRTDPETEVYDQVGPTFTVWVPAGLVPVPVVIDTGLRCQVTLDMGFSASGVMGGKLYTRLNKKYSATFQSLRDVETDIIDLAPSDLGIEPMLDATASAGLTGRLEVAVGFRLYDAFGILVGPYLELESKGKTTSLQGIHYVKQKEQATEANMLTSTHDVLLGAAGSVFAQSDAWNIFARSFGIDGFAGKYTLSYPLTGNLMHASPVPSFGVSRVPSADGNLHLSLEYVEPEAPSRPEVSPTYKLRLSTQEGKSSVGEYWLEIDEFTDKDDISKFMADAGLVTLNSDATYYLCLDALYGEETFGCSDELALPTEPLQEDTDKFFLASNGVTIMCPDARVGETGLVNGKIYRAVDNATISEMDPKFDDYTSICTSKVTDLSQLFENAKGFNQPIGNWDTSNVTNMYKLFELTDEFDQPIGAWDTSNVVNMDRMFTWATAFNQPIGAWDTSNVRTMVTMFSSAARFDQSLRNWDTSRVLDMRGMFNWTQSFEQDISTWCVSNISTRPQNFDADAGFEGKYDRQPQWGRCGSL